MRTNAWFPTLFVLALALGACGSAAVLSPSEAQVGGVYPYGAEAPAAESADAARSALDASGFAGSAAAVERLVIETGNLSLVVVDPAVSAEAIRAMAESMGGFVVSSNLYQTSYGDPAILATQASITIRVPSARFREALEQLKDGAEEVRAENTTAQDVTQEYTDLQSRLRNLEAAESQLRGIMESATKTEDVLQIFQNLRQVREEIEVTKGQIQYYEDSARLSAISIELIPDIATQPLQIGGWKPEGTAKLAIEALVRGLQTLADWAIWAVICGVPAALLLGLPGWAIVRTARRRRAARAAEVTKPEAP
ncbi:MAG: DUF4349 domain-containing protein [Anaerolineales bacterium]